MGINKMMHSVGERIKRFKEQNTKVFWVIVVLGALVLFSTFASCSNTNEPSSSDTGSAVVQEETIETGTLSFTLTAADWNTADDESIVIKVVGETEDGEKVSEKYKAVPDQKYDLNMLPGEYEFSLDTGHPSKGSNIYKCDTEKAIFDGKSDKNVVLVLELDTEAIAEAERIAAEAAQKEAEKKATAEQAAAEKAAAEAEAARLAQEQAAAQKAAAEQSAAKKAASENQTTVYVAASGNGKKYH